MQECTRHSSARFFGREQEGVRSMHLSQSHYLAKSTYYAVIMFKVARCTVEDNYATAIRIMRGMVINETDGFWSQYALNQRLYTIGRTLQ